MKIVNFLVYAAIKSLLFSARLVPMRLTFALFGWLGRLSCRLAGTRRELALYNLELALGNETTPEERQRIAEKSFENLFYAMAEMLHMDSIYNNWEKHFTFEGAHVLERLIEEGKGFFVFGGHFGGWTSMASVVYRFPDLPGLNMLARPLRNPKMQQLLEYVGRKKGGEIITSRGTGEKIVERIRKGELVGLYMDQESRRDQGIFVKFFGRDALTHVVPGHLAWKYDIPLIPYWIHRVEPGKFHIVLKDPLRYELTQDPDENNRRVAQLIQNEIERTVRETPEQWLWAHNRWRRRPDGTKIEIHKKKKRGSRTRARKKGVYLSSEDYAKKK